MTDNVHFRPGMPPGVPPNQARPSMPVPNDGRPPMPFPPRGDLPPGAMPPNRRRPTAMGQDFVAEKAVLVFLMPLLFIWHLFLGSDILVLSTFMVISITGFAFLFSRELYFSRVFVFLLSVYCAFGALVIKAGFGQPLQSNLFEPTKSTAYVALGFFSVVACALLSKPYFFRETREYLIRSFNDLAFLRTFTIWLFAIGMTFNVLHTILRPQLVHGVLGQGAGFGGFGSFYFILLLAVCMQLRLYGQHRNFNNGLTLAIMGGLMLAVAVIANVKSNAFDFIFICLFGCYAFSIRIKLRYIVGTLLLLVLILGYVGPVVHLMRFGVGQQTLMERFETILAILAAYEYNMFALLEAERSFFQGFGGSYKPGGSYIFPATGSWDRFALVFPVDQVTRAFDRIGLVGPGPILYEGLLKILPSFLVDKSSAAGSDIIAWTYEFRTYGVFSRPVVGLTASSLAVGGPIAIAILPWILIYPTMVIIDSLTGPLRWNAWALLVFALSARLAEQTIDGVLLFTIRGYLLAFVGVMIILFIYRRMRGI